MDDRERCAKETGVAPDSFTNWDLRSWLAFGEPEKPPRHEWRAPPLAPSQSVCQRCGDRLKHGTTVSGHPYTERWCWKTLREEYAKAKEPIVTPEQIDRMLQQGLISQEQVEPLLQATWGL